jgi:GH15 family glucan-1,4-alpha-glucosidase
MILHSPGDIYPGPFTYKRFWFRDAAFVLQAMTATGLLKNIEKIIDRFPGRQTPAGYFMSQDGEWDSNGQAIWAMKRFIDSTKGNMKKEWAASIYKAAKWIEHKRISSDKDPLHTGLLPAGFSAEHFGPSDFYYWDDFWGVTGLRDAAALARVDDPKMAQEFQNQADDLLNAIENSVASVQDRLHHPGIPASPSRRMDAGAIGCLVASYPLQIYAEKDERILQTTKFLMDKYFLQGSFYHEISHSGINIYLTLHIAQVLLRAGNPKFFDIVQSVATLATATGQWPEAIHPRTKGGCMGDGQHVWASAEWVMMLRNMFVREEQAEELLILCSGIPDEWLKPKEVLFLGPTHTLYGEISVTIKVKEDIEVSWQARWHGPIPKIEIRLPGYEPYTVKGNATSVKMGMMEAAV